MARGYRVDFLVGSDVDDSGVNSLLDYDPATERGGGPGVYLDPIGGTDPAVHLPAGFVIESFHVEVEWTPSITGEADLILNIDNASLVDIFTANLTLGPGSGITGTDDYTPNTATFTVGALPFTMPTEGWISFAVIFDPSSPGRTVASGFLLLNTLARWSLGKTI